MRFIIAILVCRIRWKGAGKVDLHVMDRHRGGDPILSYDTVGGANEFPRNFQGRPRRREGGGGIKEAAGQDSGN